MRGRIIHYNANDAKGLISANNRQYPFEIGQWQSETAPAVNVVVDFEADGERPTAVRRVSDEVLMKERAGELAEKAGAFAGKLGVLGGAALKNVQSEPGSDFAPNPVARVGKPALIAAAVFAVGALFLPFIKINTGFGPSTSFSLSGLSKLAEQLGASVGSGLLVWMGILSILLPMFWRHRFAWLALLLPLIATLKPVWDLKNAMADAQAGIDSGMGAEFSQAMAKQMAEMFDFGMGIWVCGLAALVLAAIGVKRFLLSPKN